MGVLIVSRGDVRWDWQMWLGLVAAGALFLVEVFASFSGRPKPIVIPGFREEEWHRWQASCEDGDTFADDHHTWHVETQRLSSELEMKLGAPVIVRTIGFDEYEDWARARGLPLRASTRADYAEWMGGRLRARRR